MISKDMYKTLNKIPKSPNKIHFIELINHKNNELIVPKGMLEIAMEYNYIKFVDNSSYNMLATSPFCLTEEGQKKVEEYKRQKLSSAKATCAIIISGLSFIVSVVSIIISICDVQ